MYTYDHILKEKKYLAEDGPNDALLAGRSGKRTNVSIKFAEILRQWLCIKHPNINFSYVVFGQHFECISKL